MINKSQKVDKLIEISIHMFKGIFGVIKYVKSILKSNQKKFIKIFMVMRYE